MLLKARPYQLEAVQSLWDYFAQKAGNPVIAMPTGTGKSVVIASFLESIFRQFPNQKVLVLTHVKELIKQNYDKLKALWPHAPAGIYSSGLGYKDIFDPIIFAGIASIAKHAALFGLVHLVIIDEAHLVSPKEETMYQILLAQLRAVNPHLKVIGLTATPWRLGQGKITEDGIFTDVCFDITSMGAFNRLIKEGYLAPLIPRHTDFILDISGVHKLGGEFKENELQHAIDKDAITHKALTETIQHGTDRKHWLIFASGVDHSENIAHMLSEMGVECRAVHSKMTSKKRDENIAEWLNGEFTAMTNNGILTTGVDFPALDMIVMLRPTASTVLWVQMLGRGTRPFEGKDNCLVLDFAGNTARLGPINDPVIPRPKGQGTGEAPIRICDVCNMYNHASARFCGGEPFKTAEGCGHAFTFQTKLKAVASTNELIKDDLPIVKVFNIDSVTYAAHTKAGKPPSMRVSYYCGMQKFTEYVHFELEGWGQRKARVWWTQRTNQMLPVSTELALQQSSTLNTPARVRIWVNKPYPEIMAVCFDTTSEFK
jgi:DNA repair protein RadD